STRINPQVKLIVNYINLIPILDFESLRDSSFKALLRERRALRERGIDCKKLSIKREITTGCAYRVCK
ncbi:hypothetical protein GIB67_017431, partial [Kingdonia uniflora]